MTSNDIFASFLSDLPGQLDFTVFFFVWSLRNKRTIWLCCVNMASRRHCRLPLRHQTWELHRLRQSQQSPVGTQREKTCGKISREKQRIKFLPVFRLSSDHHRPPSTKQKHILGLILVRYLKYLPKMPFRIPAKQHLKQS